MTRLPRSASAFASGSCMRWLSRSPCRSTTIREPSPYSLYASVRPSWRNVVIPAVPNLSKCRRFLLTSMMPYRWGILRPWGVSPARPRPRSAVLLRVASDERLVALVRGGSEAAFEAIYDRHHRGILAFSRHMLVLGRRGGGRGPAHVHGRLPPPRGRRRRDPAPAVALHDRAQPLPLDAARPPRAPARRAPRAGHRAPVGRGAAAPGRPRAARRRRGAARGPAGRAGARRARRRLARRDRHGARRPAAEGEGARVPGPHLADREPDGARHPVRGDPRAAREPPRRRAAADDAAPPPARVPGLPGVPRAGRVQRKTLAVALPVLPTLGLKEAALGAAFGSAGAGGGAAAATGGCGRGEGARGGRAGRRRHDGQRRGRAPRHPARAEGGRACTAARRPAPKPAAGGESRRRRA